MASEASQEAKELSLIGKVEFRIAAAESDAKLESLLNTYLAPLLLKLSSEHQSVRNKVLFSPSSRPLVVLHEADEKCVQVITLCQHVSARLKAP